MGNHHYQINKSEQILNVPFYSTIVELASGLLHFDTEYLILKR